MLGEIPILASEQRLLDEAGGDEEEATGAQEAKAGTSKPKVLADGTYATETALSSTSAARLEAIKAAAKPPLRSIYNHPSVDFWLTNFDFFKALILQGDFYTGSVLAATLAKLVLRYSESSSDIQAKNSLRAEVRSSNYMLSFHESNWYSDQ